MTYSIAFVNDDRATARRRWTAEAQRERDAEVMNLYLAGASHRGIAKRLGLSLGTVHYVIRREQKLRDALATGEPVAAVSDELTAEDVQTVEDMEKLNELERHRFRYLPIDHPARAVAERWVPSPAWRAAHPPRSPITYPVVDDDGSWRERCDKAMSGDHGAVDDDW